MKGRMQIPPSICDICGRKRGHAFGGAVDHSKCSKIRQRRRIAEQIAALNRSRK